jgi:hypothetical protein
VSARCHACHLINGRRTPARTFPLENVAIPLPRYLARQVQLLQAKDDLFRELVRSTMLANGKITVRSRLGFIGLGYLGSRIARRLITAGFSMVVYDRGRAKTGEFADLGAEVAQHPGDLAAKVDEVLSCLADGPAVKAVYLGTGNVGASARPGTRIIDLSTVSPETSRQLQAAARFDLSALDVAISGSTHSAEAAPLRYSGAANVKSLKRPSRFSPRLRSSGFIWGRAAPVWL